METYRRIQILAILLFTSNILWAQLTRISSIEIFGNRKISSNQIYASLGLAEGDSIDLEKFKFNNRVSDLKRIPGIRHVSINPVCCDTGNMYMLYIGVAENDSILQKYRKSPEGNIQLPKKIKRVYGRFLQQLKTAVLKGENSEEHLNGYSLSIYPPLRLEQKKFIAFANREFPILEKVLRESRHADQRAAAAQIIAYSGNKSKIIDVLLLAMNDEDENVRNNATRALAILASFVSENRNMMTKLPAEPFINMLNSVSWTDRNKGAMVLTELTKSRDERLLEKIRSQAMASIIEMAKWRNRGHAFFSYLIFGRIVGEDEDSLLEGNFSNNWPMNVQRFITEIQQTK
jgi:hypothetical protein